MVNNNIISFGSHQSDTAKKQPPQHQDTIKACRQILKQSLPECFGFFNDLDDSLFRLADRAENNQQQDEYFAIMRLFRIKKDNIKQSFTQLVLDDFDSFWLNPSLNVVSEEKSSALTSDLELSLMQNDALEEDIALKSVATKGDLVLGNQLNQLDHRFAYILNSDALFENPLSSEQVADNLKKVISPITSNISALLVTYKQFEQYALPALATLYQALNKALIEEGILPKLIYKQQKSSSKQDPTSSVADDKKVDIPDDLSDDASIFAELRQLIGPQSNSSSSFNVNSGPTAPQNSVMTALSGLQQQSNSPLSSDESGAITLPDLRQLLLNNLSQTQSDGTVVNQSLSKIDEDTMNVIAMLFEFVLEDRSIPAPIRALLARLQLPMLKVAITDKEFFSKKKHTARQLLNNLARVSTGWDHTNGTSDILFSQIESIVNKILTDFDTDMQIFTDLNDQLTLFIQQQEKRSGFAEQRIAQATEGQERLVAAQQEVEQLINQLLAKYSPVPKAVVTLVDDSWRKILKLRFLQKGKDSPEWQEAVALMEQLLWSVAPKYDASERKELIAIIPTLLKSLRDTLSGASFNQHNITALFKDLKECHIKCLDGKALEEEELQTIDEQEVPINDVEKLISIPEEKKVLSDENALKAAKELEVGTWLEVTHSDQEQVQRIKFSWRSNLTGRCLFVTYQGLKAEELELAELANWFQLGQAIILDQASAPLMDRALVSMKESIEEQNSPTAAEPVAMEH